MQLTQNWRDITWLASYPKSGNTWVRCFIDTYFKEKVEINNLTTVISDDQADLLDLSKSEIRDILTSPADIQLFTRPYLLYNLVSKYKKAKTELPFIIKTHSALVNIGGMGQIPPGLTKRIVYIVRNPLDIVPSFADHFNMTLDETITFLLDDASAIGSVEDFKFLTPILSWKIHVNSYLQIAQEQGVKIVKYEDIKENPEKEFFDILEFIGIEPDTKRLTKTLDLIHIDKLKELEITEGFIENPKTAKGKFFGDKRRQLNSNHRKRIISNLKEEMTRFGYLI